MVIFMLWILLPKNASLLYLEDYIRPNLLIE